MNTMNLQAEKLNILQTIISSDDEALIMDVKAFLSDRKTDWFDELSEDQQKDVLDGLAEADKGDTVTHAEVVKIFGKWGLK
jgi:predicted transcriptional regulator